MLRKVSENVGINALERANFWSNDVADAGMAPWVRHGRPARQLPIATGPAQLPRFRMRWCRQNQLSL